MVSATRLFVGNIPDNAQEEDLASAFSAFGKITNLDLKSKVESGSESKKFAFVSISAQNIDVESCIKHFSNEDFNGKRLYVTRARESFLERLQRERAAAQQKETEKDNHLHHKPDKNPVLNLSDKLNPKKRKIDHIEGNHSNITRKNQTNEGIKLNNHGFGDDPMDSTSTMQNKKNEAERKRMESIKKKRQEFKEKKMIIKTGLTGVDKVQNKKIVFDDSDDDMHREVKDKNRQKDIKVGNGNSLFNDDVEESDEELNFEVKKQFEGKKGQKVLDLQSRYKSDKRFTLDERFMDDEANSDEKQSENEEVELGPADEKAKQLNILQDVLGVTLKTRDNDSDSKKIKPKLGMLRFDPMQPDHAKFLTPMETKLEPPKKSKKKMKEEKHLNELQPVVEVPKVEVSKEQFYKVSETLKEAIAQPNTFSLRSLFGQGDNIEDAPQKQETDYIPLETAKDKKKVKNPLDPTDKNPFVYDSSDSESEEPEKNVKTELPPPPETKAVWKENLFFSKTDSRLKDGLIFFTRVQQNEVQKERRELKSLVKKRLYNNDRKNQMFKKKIGGRKKSMKKPYKKKN
ncbi:unnamed protein product [Arctia plantaginis]|uniref:RRM domain-containing protein n=1 Tax=Arctia plantaginis TaxID=874455 RepID=A0A8S0ZTF2_ARCPL|nr:unnamed protein product [Arctia plantaginis]